MVQQGAPTRLCSVVVVPGVLVCLFFEILKSYLKTEVEISHPSVYSLKVPCRHATVVVGVETK